MAPRLTPRVNFNPPARRRVVALMASVLVLLAGMVAAAIATGRGPQVKVPGLVGLMRAAAASRATAAGLRPVFTARYDRSRAEGVAISQAPAIGMEVGRGSTVRVDVSAGPPPVQLPRLTGESVADAAITLKSLGLRPFVTDVVDPGQTPQTITTQFPGPGASVLPGSTVSLTAVEWPRWRELESVAGDGQSRSFSFRIRGTRWRLVYDMTEHGVCSWLSLLCSAPWVSAGRVGGPGLGSFSLSQGEGQTATFATGPGEYRLEVAPGEDAGWSMTVEDYY